jgi:hypothetical protein
MDLKRSKKRKKTELSNYLTEEYGASRKKKTARSLRLSCINQNISFDVTE